MKTRYGPAGVQVFDRRSGLNVLADEITVTRDRWASSPRHVSVALTNLCDLSCAYCYAPKHAAVLHFEKLVRWLHELDNGGCLGVGFGGGEPTLYPGFTDLCRYAAQRTGLAVTVTTHGHRLDSSMLSALKGNVHFMRVSIDGVGPTYERLRRRSYARLCERLRSVRTIVPFGINYVVNADTFPDLDAAVDLASSMGASEFLLLPEQRTENRCGADPFVLASLRAWIYQYRGKVPLAIGESAAHGLPTCNPVEREAGLRAYAYISASGIVMKSSFDRFGVSIREDGFSAALNALRRLCKET